MRSSGGWVGALLCGVMGWLGVAGPGPAVAADVPTATLGQAAVAARGKQSTVLTVSAFGRYAVTATSSQGVGLNLIDRMAGAGEMVGEPGRKDGRLDRFLDRGEYKVVTQAAERGAGQVALAAHAFRELSQPVPLLVEQRLERAVLGDFEQRSYWLEIKERRIVAIEAAGRHLADLRLWRDGLWLVDAAPRLQLGQAKPEQPLAVARLNLALDPGLYLLTAYGGPSQPWTEASEQKPFLLRLGLPTLPPELRQQFTMGELGVERFVVSGAADYFRLELPNAEPATLQVENYDPANAFGNGGSSAQIDKRSLPPVTELRFSSNRDKLVTVTAAPGKSFVLQHFQAAHQRTFEGSGHNYWIGSIHAGTPDDSVGATAVLTRRPRNGKEELLGDRVIDLDESWRRRFNLLETLTLFVKVPHPTMIRIAGEGVKARYRLEPFLTSRPADYQTAPAHESGHLFPVLSGIYVLTVIPETKGILDLQLLPGLSLRSSALTPVAAAVRFPEIRLDDKVYYTMYLNQQPGVPAGAVIRRLPIDLRSALPVFQPAGETLQVPISVDERGTLSARSEDGKLINLSLDDKKSGTRIAVEPGRYRLTVPSASVGRSYSLGLEPLRLASTKPLPLLPDTRLAGLPKFPLITPEAPSFLDLDRQRSATYNVRVDQPGLYQFESTGLLHTDGRVRTRVNPALFAEKRNGVGGNFMIQRYLREGDYQLAVATLGETRGHLGVRLASTGVVDGGELREGDVARAQLPPGRALAYRFRVVKRGNFRLQAMGLGRSFDVRLEDEQGWPVESPIQRGDLNVDLEPGGYRLLVMPQTHEARLLTRLDRSVEAKHYRGHGPHRISLGSSVVHTWRESAKKPKRAPDEWDFALPAAAEVTLSVNNDMAASLINPAAPKSPLASFDARQAWRGSLPAGRYRVQVKTAGKNNLVEYTLQTASTQLLPGQTRTVSVPTVLPVSIGSDSLVEIESFGAADVRGRLLDSTGEIVAQSDDRTGDWNFLIAQRLRPGDYRLQIDPVGEARASTTVSIGVPGEVVEKVLPYGKDVEIRDARVHVFPLAAAAGSNVLLASARSSDAVGLSLEGETPGGWVNLGSLVEHDPALALPLGEGFSSYRVRAWSADRRSLRLSLRAVVANLPAATETRWSQGGVTPQAVDPARPGTQLALVSLARPGVFRLGGDLSHWRWTDSGQRTARDSGDAVIALNGKAILLAGESAGGGTPLPSAERLRLPSGEQESLRLELTAGQTGVIDLQPSPASLSLLLAQSRTGQPGVALDEARDPAAIGFVAGESVTVVMPGIAIPAKLWNAAGSSQPIELDVRQLILKPAEVRPLALGIGEDNIAARGVVALNLPGAGLSVRLTLPPASAAVFTRQGRALSTHWAGNEALQETVLTGNADQLLLLNAGPDEARYGVELAPAPTKAESPLRPGELFERNLSSTGRLRIPVEVPKAAPGAATTYRLRVAGHLQALWQERGGRVASGEDIAIGDSGSLWVRHRPGTLVAWLEETGAGDSTRGERWRKDFGETRVIPPQTISLNGKQKLLGFDFAQPTMLHVRSETPLVSQFLVNGQAARTDAHLHGAQANFPLPAAKGLLLLRAVGADSLSGGVTVNTTPVLKLNEGQGPEVLLGPGSARLFWFELAQPATIGIGVRASADVIRAVLYDEHGLAKSEGVVQMPALAAGRYFLMVEMPAESAPVSVRAIVLGLARPDTRPPYEILRRYVENLDGEGAALLYVPPPPAPPPSTVEVPDEEVPAEAAGEGEGAAENGESGQEHIEENAGDMPAEEAQ